MIGARRTDAGRDDQERFRTHRPHGLDVGRRADHPVAPGGERELRECGYGFGGLSGPAIKPIAVRCVWQVHRALPHVPIIGMGGVAGVEDAVEMILAGATAVAVGTANFYDPTATETIARALADFCEAHGIASLDEIRGQVKIEG